jgi:hypothetical protein
LLTVPEYILAKQQECYIKMKSVFYIPPTEKISINKKKKCGTKNKKVGVWSGQSQVRIKRWILYNPPSDPLAYLLLLWKKAAQDGDYKNLEKITRKVLFLISYIRKWVIQSMEMLWEVFITRRVSTLGLDTFTGKSFWVTGTDL